MSAHSPADDERVVQAYLRQWDLVEEHLLGLADAMPADRYDFRPAGPGFESARTFGEQVRHTATVIFLAAAVVMEEPSPYRPGPGDNGPLDVPGKDPAVAYLRESLAYARRALGSLSEANHLELVRTVFGLQPRFEVANGLVHHCYNHYGQMVVYARMHGIVPPSSR